MSIRVTTYDRDWRETESESNREVVISTPLTTLRISQTSSGALRVDKENPAIEEWPHR